MSKPTYTHGMSTYTRPQYTVRWGDGEAKFVGANYPKASKVAAEKAPSFIECDGRIIKVVAVFEESDPFEGLGSTDFEKGIL